LMFMSTADESSLTDCITTNGCSAADACIMNSPLAAAFACGC
jgi:hypothetical protein